MALFEYTHVTAAGQESRDIVDAASLAEARRRLRTVGLHVVEIAQKQADGPKNHVSGTTRVRRVGARELSTATRELSVLMLAGMPLVAALSTLVEQLGDSHLGRIFAQVRDSVTQGVTLAKAMEEYPSIFSNIYVSMVEAGEAAGTLEEVLSQLADLYERRATLTSQVKSALAYPLFMVVVGVGVVVFVLSFVLPSITKLFLEMKMRLPWPTVLLIETSGLLSRYFWVLALLVGGLLGANVYWIRTSPGRRFWDQLKLRCPILGKVMVKVAVSRFCRTLGVVLSSGVTIVDALRLAERVAGNVVIAETAADVREAVGHGDTVAGSLRRHSIFPPLVVNMIAAGEQSGTIEDSLSRISELLDRDVEVQLGTLTALLEPVMILLLGAIIGFIVLALLLPIFDINQAIG